MEFVILRVMAATKYKMCANANREEARPGLCPFPGQPARRLSPVEQEFSGYARRFATGGGGLESPMNYRFIAACSFRSLAGMLIVSGGKQGLPACAVIWPRPVASADMEVQVRT
ncbi:MAG: hypothetical protein P8130_10310 [Deltaproteobacteria bacterium]